MEQSDIQRILSGDPNAPTTTQKTPVSQTALAIAVALLAIVVLALLAIIIWLAATGIGTIPSGTATSSLPSTSQAPPEVFFFQSNNPNPYTNIIQARTACESISGAGATLASRDQLTQAWQAGAQWCMAGYVAENILLYPMQVAVQGCGNKAGINQAQTVFGGATCYGVKPAQNTVAGVYPFSPTRWSQFS